ncbi:acetylglutamate kinase [Convivina praedatoris]|uniref:acetylglutamate kinase n=1 Tax=Convivina praedatoris TaxID=2880963 RepID=A0ABN8HE95_9LACO|nr:acetylglutamate kinase [Convivina sp. LMG 32447]CAH1853835.1 Acetylglutamate kinase [Convivina sp. LMG 32447]CAH1854636.1 Acetylglutamate kinase [Convivina sp. LMG 32447]CAH1855258.1 Acetylglutamate kinase [Convivina sp. LMG 32447]
MIIIKIGGNAIHQLTNDFFKQIQTWLDQQKQIIIVHGGGQLITATSEFFDLPVQKIDGIRKTSSAEMLLTQGLLSDVIQPYFAQLFQQHGIDCQPLNLNGQTLLQGQYGQVGQVTSIQTKLLEQIPNDRVILINSLAQTPQGQLLNVNADQAAQALAVLTQAQQLILLTDVPGILVDQELQTKLTPILAQQFIQAGQITGGMVPKIKAALASLNDGVQQITITNQLNHLGTTITH